MTNTMFRNFTLALFGVILSFSMTWAQSITVIDQLSQEPIPSAKIYSLNPKIQRLSNVQGRFELSDFNGCDSLFVSYPNFEVFAGSFSEVKEKGIVELSEKSLAVSEMIVTANRWEQDKAKVPNRIAKLNTRELMLTAPQTTADLLESSGYVFVQKSQLAGGSPQLRGFGTNRVMIVVDGVRMNNAIFRTGNLQNVISIDANSLDGAEVLFGPGAVMYGSDAIGGVMDFKTKAPQFTADSLRPFVRANVFSRYSSANNESTSHLDFNLGFKKWAFLTSATYSYFDDLKTGTYGNDYFLRPTYQTTIDGKDTTVANPNPKNQVESGYEQLNFLQRIRFQPNVNWNFDYGFSFSTTSNAPRYDRLTLDSQGDGVLDNAEWYYGPQQWMMHRLTLLHSAENNTLFDEFRMTAAYQMNKESRHDRKTNKSEIRRQFERVDAASVNIDFDKKMGSRLDLFYGVEGVFNEVSSNAYRENIYSGYTTEINSRYPNGSTWQTYGAYANLKYDISDVWTLNAGGRYTYYHIEADFDTTLFSFPVTHTTNQSDAVNGSVGVVFNPNARTQVYFNASTGFRAPNIDDIGKVFDSEPGRVVIPNVDLKPEYAYSGEVGFVKSIKNVVKIDGAVYYTYLKDALARANTTFMGQDSILYEGVVSQVQSIQNVSHAYVYGVQAGVELVFGKGFSVKSTISYQQGFEYHADSAAYYPKMHITPLYGRTSISYKRRKFNASIYAVYQGEMSAEDLPLTERGDPVYALDDQGNSYTPSWYTLNVKAVYFFNKHFSVSGGVENITDQRYRTMGSGISAPGRNFIITLKATI